MSTVIQCPTCGEEDVYESQLDRHIAKDHEPMDLAFTPEGIPVYVAPSIDKVELLRRTAVENHLGIDTILSLVEPF